MGGFADQARIVFNIFLLLIGFHYPLEHAGNLFGADFMGLAAGFLGFDHLTEGHGLAHRCGVAIQFFLGADFGQRLPATHDLAGVIHFQGVVFIFPQRLQTAVDVAFFHRQHNHLVIAQQAALHRFGKGDDVEFLAVQGFVIHGTQRHVFFVRFGFRLLAINARGGGHVQAFGGAQKFGVVYFHEGAFIFAAKGCAGGAVGFVADNQIEVRQLVFVLRFADHINGVVGAEHHAHVAGVMALGHFHRQTFRFGGGGIAQFVGEGLHGVVIALALFLAHVAVGTHGKAVQRNVAFLRPFGEDLRQQ